VSLGLEGRLPILVLVATMTTGCWVVDFGGIEIDPGYIEEDEPDAGCATRMVPSGSVETSQLSLGYDGGKLSVASVHKVDADAIEDGCVSRLDVTVAMAQGQCPLKLVFLGKNGTFGGLAEVKLTADSACPGFLDAVEGVYSSPQAGFAPWSFLGPQQVPERMASAVCLDSARIGFPDRVIRLYRTSPSPAELSINLKGLVLDGQLFSKGNPDSRCFDASSCGPGLHDGGDGWCVAEDKCSPGYRLSLEGSCAK
jgi:hypothetical protein